MIVALSALVALVVVLLWKERSRRKDVVRETTPELDAWLCEALEHELAERVLAIRGSTPEERRKLATTLADEPDADVVAKIEEIVSAVDLEFVRYAHESDVEATVRVRYEDGAHGSSTRRIALGDVPADVRVDFEKKGTTRVFRSWTFPWQRARAL
jgi:hypothetical protein